MKKKTQILFIHGGMTFKNQTDYIDYLKNREINLDNKKKWNHGYLRKKLKNCEIISPQMPLKENAKYSEWKINFEKYLEITNDSLILIGFSLGGIFLVKYLSENKIDKNIISTYLIAAPFEGSLTGEDLVGGFELKNNLSLIDKQSPNTTFYFSRNDDVVPVEHANKFKEKLKKSTIEILGNKNGHFQDEKFPELIEAVKKDIRMS